MDKENYDDIIVDNFSMIAEEIEKKDAKKESNNDKPKKE